jgi:hypothetical protein
MVKSNWVYRKLRNFRAGIESDISCLKRAYGLVRCLWRGLDHFTAYVWSSALAYNLALLAHLKPAMPPKPSPGMRYPFGGPRSDRVILRENRALPARLSRRQSRPNLSATS